MHHADVDLTQAESFRRDRPTIEGFPHGTKCAVLIIVFDDGTFLTSVPKGDESLAQTAISAAADAYGIGPGTSELTAVHNHIADGPVIEA